MLYVKLTDWLMVYVRTVIQYIHIHSYTHTHNQTYIYCRTDCFLYNSCLLTSSPVISCFLLLPAVSCCSSLTPNEFLGATQQNNKAMFKLHHFFFTWVLWQLLYCHGFVLLESDLAIFKLRCVSLPDLSVSVFGEVQLVSLSFRNTAGVTAVAAVVVKVVVASKPDGAPSEHRLAGATHTPSPHTSHMCYEDLMLIITRCIMLL